MTFDGGALRLDVDETKAGMSENDALRLWASSGEAGALQATGDAVVFRALATVLSTIQSPHGRITIGSGPRFVKRSAWVFIWDLEGIALHCGSNPITSRSRFPSKTVELIATDGSGEGVVYSSRGSAPCGGDITQPTLGTAMYSESLPWTVAGETATTLTISVQVPDCGTITGLLVASVPPTISVAGSIVMNRGPCGGKHLEAREVDRNQFRSPPIHAATGLTGGRTGRYFDGSYHETAQLFEK